MRYFVVLEAHLDHVIVELMEPEDDCGEMRRMNFDGFGEVLVWDGYPPEDDDDYDDDDEDTDCDCCSHDELW
jgi:hypothetical protein